jgi:hypothetical protein
MVRRSVAKERLNSRAQRASELRELLWIVTVETCRTRRVSVRIREIAGESTRSWRKNVGGWEDAGEKLGD